MLHVFLVGLQNFFYLAPRGGRGKSPGIVKKIFGTLQKKILYDTKSAKTLILTPPTFLSNFFFDQVHTARVLGGCP